MTNVTIAGTTDENTAAIMVEVISGTDTVAMESFPVVNEQFSGIIRNLSLTAGNTYTVRIADYEGGAWKSTSILIPVSNGGAGSKETTAVKKDNISTSISVVPRITTIDGQNVKSRVTLQENETVEEENKSQEKTIDVTKDSGQKTVVENDIPEGEEEVESSLSVNTLDELTSKKSSVVTWIILGLVMLAGIITIIIYRTKMSRKEDM